MVRIADAYHKLHQTDDAIDFYRQSLAIRPHDAFALLGLGNVYYAEHDDMSALRCFEELMKFNETHNVVVMTMVGNIYRRRKEYDRATEQYQNALDLDPKNNFALFGMGDCCRGKLDLDRAVYWWDKILEQEPDNQALWTRVGDALVNLDRLDDAVRHYEASLKSGHDIYALLGLARAKVKRGNFSQALQHCERALAEDENHPRVLEEMAKIHELNGDADAAARSRSRIKVE
jgi:tetratricopeptide (TPR) repeat protein